LRLEASSLKIAMASAYFALMSGGGEYYTLYLSRALRKLGHEIEIVCGKDIFGRHIPLSDEFPLHLVPQVYALRQLAMKYPKLSPFLWRVHEHQYAYNCRKYLADRYDVVHVHDPGSLIAVASARPTGASVATLHGRPAARLKKFLKRLDGIIAVSEDVASNLRGMGFDPVVVTPGVDFEIFHPMGADRCRRELGLDGRVILFVGRLNRLKGLEYLIAAMKKVNERFENARLVIVGDGPLEESCRELSSSHGIADSVIFKGRVSHTDLPKFYVAADVLVLPSFYESFSMVVLEAMASGCPVVTTRNVQAVMAMGDEASEVISAGDSDAIASSVTAILADEALAADMRGKGFEFVKTFDWTTRAVQVEQIYDEVTGRR